MTWRLVEDVSQIHSSSCVWLPRTSLLIVLAEAQLDVGKLMGGLCLRACHLSTLSIETPQFQAQMTQQHVIHVCTQLAFK